jgi:heat shock protein HtpX
VKRKNFGRDRGLSLRILATGGLLGLLYVVFGVILVSLLNVGVVAVLVIVIGLAFVQYWTSDKLALAASGAKIVSADEAPELHAMVERLCAMADLPKPRIAVVDSTVPNAFATGRNPKHAAVAVTSGLWQRLEPQEIESVLAHELSHIANRDVLVMTVASFFAMLAAFITRWGLYAGMFGGFGGGGGGFGGGRSSNSNNQGGVPIFLIILAVSIITYAISFVLIRTISRYREYTADRGSALITGTPENLMSALQKISSGITQIPQQDLREVAGMNAFFIIPTNWRTQAGELFMDHPPLEKRLAALAAIAREMGRPVS